MGLIFIIIPKWFVDSLFLPLRAGDWSMYLDIHIASALRLRRMPNLRNPSGYNDQVKWLMLFAQHPLMPICADKVKVRDYVADQIGSDFLVRTKAVSRDWLNIEPLLWEGPGVLKCSHDSGSSTLFEDMDLVTAKRLESRFREQLLRQHGYGKGEWHYRHIVPQLVLEEKLPGPRPGAGPIDVKVHCVEGEPRLVHVIEDRQGDSRQAFFSAATGKRLELRVKPHRKRILEFDFEVVRCNVLPLVSRLAEPFRYVRVDFYLVGDAPYFGELTFFEEAGLFSNRLEEQDLARAIGLKCYNPQPTIHTVADRK